MTNNTLPKGQRPFTFPPLVPAIGRAKFIREKTLDTSELETYGSKAPATLDGHPIKVLAAYGRHLTLEGPDIEGVVIAEFPSLEEARAWYDSPGYQEAAQHRFRGAVYRGLIVEGASPQ